MPPVASDAGHAIDQRSRLQMVSKLNRILEGRYRSLLFTLLLGIVGSLIALALRLPIPWMLGSLLFCAAGKLVGLPVQTLHPAAERWMRVAIGVFLGPPVASSIQSAGSDLPFAMVAAILITTITVAIGTPWFLHRTELPRRSAFMSAFPGGLSMLLALAGDIGHRAEVLLIHAVRVVIVVVSISLLARVLGVPAEPDPLVASLRWSTQTSILLLGGLIVFCFLIAEKLRWAGGHVMIPMIITALLTFFTGINIEPPALLKTCALLVFGIVIGCEVANGPRELYLRLFRTSTIFTVAVMGLAAALALAMTGFIDQGFMVLFLALAPGGIAEVSLVAFALGLDAGLVALVHSCRFIFIISAGPLCMKFFKD
ncbi:MAG: AbrB family transcriptional regulator [Granulosicoccus sp.]